MGLRTLIGDGLGLSALWIWTQRDAFFFLVETETDK